MNTKTILTTLFLLLVVGALIVVGRNGSLGGAFGPTPATKGKLPAGSTPVAEPSTLVGTWIWQQTIMRNGPIITPRKVGIFTITLTNNGRVSGKTDCNGFGGDYKVGSDGIISFGPFMSTLMYCEGSQEALFVGDMGMANRYSFDRDGDLVISIDNDAGSMIFTKK